MPNRRMPAPHKRKWRTLAIEPLPYFVKFDHVKCDNTKELVYRAFATHIVDRYGRTKRLALFDTPAPDAKLVPLLFCSI